MSTKSLIFILLVLTVAAVAFYLVWQQDQELEIPFFKNGKPAIESTSILNFGAELQAEISSFENDMADLNGLDNDSTIKNLENDLGNLNL
jgi:uncharacterized protein YaaN involved in tellurite resistance